MSEVPAPAKRLRRRRVTTPAEKFLRDTRERVIEGALFCAAALSIVVTVGIAVTLVSESLGFFRTVGLWTFLTDTMWTPLFAQPRYGVMPLVAGTLVTTFVALSVALPIGSIVAIYLCEYARPSVREIIKPSLELLSAIPTVVYGYFALLMVAPLLQMIMPKLATQNMLSAGIVMGIMIIPYVSSLSEDAMRAVPMILREGSYALGANRLTTALKVVYPAALSGIAAAYILGISRAIGETMIVAIAAGMQPKLTWNPTEQASTMTAFIVQVSQGDLPHGEIGYQSIFAVGLSLFVMTCCFNLIGFYLRHRYRETGGT